MRSTKPAGEKTYYTISEVAKMTGLEAYVLRFWEKEFPMLKPRKNRGGNRLYTASDIEMVNQINYLRTKEKLTIAGARSRLLGKRPESDNPQRHTQAKLKTVISKIRRDITELEKIL